MLFIYSDFIDYANGKFSAGVVAFVSVTVKHLGISREDVGYATSVASQKGSAIHNARKVSIYFTFWRIGFFRFDHIFTPLICFQSSVTNALRETLLSFGGTIATQLLEQLECNRLESQTNTERSSLPINHGDAPVNGGEVRNAIANSDNKKQNCPPYKDSRESSSSSGDSRKMDESKSPQRPAVAVASTAHMDKPQMSCNPRVKPTEMPNHPAKPAAGMGQGLAANQNVMKMPPPLLQQVPPNVSYVVQRVMPPLYSVHSAAPPPPLPTQPHPPHYHNAYYTELLPTAPWPLTYDNFNRHLGNVNLRCNVPPKNFVINAQPDCSQSSSSGRSVSRGFSPPSNSFMPHSVNINSSWIKPSIFYDGFWTEQKVKNWVTEQNDKECDAPAANSQNHMCHSKV